jgi:LysM repeat protein
VKGKILILIIVLLAFNVGCGLLGGDNNENPPDNGAAGGSTPTPDESPRVTPGANLPPTWTPAPTSLPPTAVPVEAGETYVVQPGDTLAEIAAQFGVTVQALAEANNIANIDVIEVNQVLVIP